jgi:hypothetical protein
MNKGNPEDESFWARRLPVKRKLYWNKTNVLEILLYSSIAECGNWIL